MTTFAARRTVNLCGLLGVSVAAFVLWRSLEASLVRTGVASGWLLFGLIVVLSLYNAKKKVPILPAGANSVWLQAHIYGGLLTGVLFFLHAGGVGVRGAFEILLASLFGAVFATGAVGLALTRVLPRQLSTAGEELLYERIPSIRRQLLTAADDLATGAVAKSGSPNVSEFYLRYLRPFFDRSCFLRVLLVGAQGVRHRYLSEIDKHLRYMTPDEREVLGQFAELVRQKSDLDFHEAGQRLLKYWLFVHVPLTYCLLIMAIVHAWVASCFSGGSG